MKKINICMRCLTLFSCAILLSACHKILDRMFPDHNHDNLCRISAMKQRLSESDVRTALFHYNEYGDLDSVIYDALAYGGNLFYYKYDQHHRLIGYEVHYDPPYDFYNYFHLHNYVYSDEGKIAIDTTRYREAGSWTQVTYLEYDLLGRVIKETGNVIEMEGDSTIVALTPKIYNYDDRGNLKSDDGPDHYDNKINFLSTRKVLMFTERNYSKNNPVEATGYNEFGLPTGFPSDMWIDKGLFILGLPVEITYDCVGN